MSSARGRQLLWRSGQAQQAHCGAFGTDGQRGSSDDRDSLNGQAAEVGDERTGNLESPTRRAKRHRASRGERARGTTFGAGRRLRILDFWCRQHRFLDGIHEGLRRAVHTLDTRRVDHVKAAVGADPRTRPPRRFLTGSARQPIRDRGVRKAPLAGSKAVTRDIYSTPSGPIAASCTTPALASGGIVYLVDDPSTAKSTNCPEAGWNASAWPLPVGLNRTIGLSPRSTDATTVAPATGIGAPNLTITSSATDGAGASGAFTFGCGAIAGGEGAASCGEVVCNGVAARAFLSPFEDWDRRMNTRPTMRKAATPMSSSARTRRRTRAW